MATWYRLRDSLQYKISPAWPQPGYIYIYIYIPFPVTRPFPFNLKHSIRYSQYIGLTQNIPLTRFCPTILTQSLPLTLFWHQIVIPSPVRLCRSCLRRFGDLRKNTPLDFWIFFDILMDISPPMGWGGGGGVGGWLQPPSTRAGITYPVRIIPHSDIYIVYMNYI